MSFWDRHRSWESAKTAWDAGAEKAQAQLPLKKLKVLPEMPGITQETARHLKWKSFKYMVTHDAGGKIRRHFLKHPLRYTLRYIKSLFKKKSYTRNGDFFFYGLNSLEAFKKALDKKESILAVGFSYCQKPHECPSGRFNDGCIRDPDNPVCRQCDIAQILHALPHGRAVPLIIPTVHYVGDKIFELVHANPDKQVLFMITACELTLEMFGDWGHMAGIKGMGIRLDGRICNTMKAFELSEEGIKPGLTVLTRQTQSRLLELIESMRGNASS